MAFQVHPTTFMIVTISSFTSIEQLLWAWPSPRCCLGHTGTETLKRKLHHKPLHSAARSFFPFLGQSPCTTPKTLEWSVSKGRLCPWVHAPGPGQLWELSASSAGSSHFTSQRRHSLRWTSTDPSGHHFSCSQSPDPEPS